MSVSFNTPFNSASVIVTASNACGTSAPSAAFTISPGAVPKNPALPKGPTGEPYNNCNATGIPFTVTATAGVGYNWTWVPVNPVISNATIHQTVANNNAATYDFPNFISGKVTV